MCDQKIVCQIPHWLHLLFCLQYVIEYDNFRSFLFVTFRSFLSLTHSLPPYVFLVWFSTIKLEKLSKSCSIFISHNHTHILNTSFGLCVCFFCRIGNGGLLPLTNDNYLLSFLSNLILLTNEDVVNLWLSKRFGVQCTWTEWKINTQSYFTVCQSDRNTSVLIWHDLLLFLSIYEWFYGIWINGFMYLSYTACGFALIKTLKPNFLLEIHCMVNLIFVKRIFKGHTKCLKKIWFDKSHEITPKWKTRFTIAIFPRQILLAKGFFYKKKLQ